MRKNLIIRLVSLAIVLVLAKSLGAQTLKSIEARNLVNSTIVTNGQKAVTAAQVNAAFNKVLDAVDSATLPRLTAPSLSSSLSGNNVVLNWNVVNSGYVYQLLRSTNSTFTNPVEVYQDKGTTFTDNSVTGTNYYRLRARSFDFLSSFYSNTTSQTAGGGSQTLAAPEFLTAASTGSTSIHLDWGSISNAESYTLDRSLVSNFASVQASNAVSAPQQTYDATGLTPSTHYYFRIRANATGYTSSGYTLGDATTDAASGGVSIQYGYTSTDPYTNDGTVPAVTYTGTYNGTNNSPITFAWPSAADGQFLVWKVPSSQSIKTTWYNATFNNGNIPDQAFRAAYTISGFTYYVTRSISGFSFDNGIYTITLQ